MDWLLEREVRRPGDWSVLNPHLEPGGWFFEYRNGFYPDTDDTAMVLMALARTGAANTPAARPAVERALRWLLGMQNSDGGWAAFDRDINREVLTKVPFADHNAMLDPSCPDITARVLEALGEYGFGVDHPQVRRALVFLRKTQEKSGCWLGRWGVNYIYGTWQVLVGLQKIGFDMARPDGARARRLAGERAADRTAAGARPAAATTTRRWPARARPTASQTAWALLALIAAGEADSRRPSAPASITSSRRRPSDGNWREEPFTGTGFPKVFYLKYHLYSLYFPLMALARYAQGSAGRPVVHYTAD